MVIRPRPAFVSFLVNASLFPALLIGLTLPGPAPRAAVPSVAVARVNDASLSAYDRPRTGRPLTAVVAGSE